MKQGMKKILSVVCAVVLLFTSIGIDVLFTNNSQSEVQAADNSQSKEFERLTLADLGVLNGQSVAVTGLTSKTEKFDAGEGTLDGTELKGIFNFSATYDTFSGTNGGGKIYVGGDSKGLVIEAQPASKQLKIMYHDGSEHEMAEGPIRITEEEIANAGFSLFGSDVILSIKFEADDITQETTDVTVIITLFDRKDPTKSYSETCTMSSQKTEYMKRYMSIMVHRTYDITMKYLEDDVTIDYEVLDLRDFGVVHETAIGDWTTSEIGSTYNAGEGTLHEVEVVGKYKFGSTTFDNGYGTTNYARVYFGGETQNFYMEYRPVKQYLEFGYNTGSGNQSFGETYRITKTDAEAAGLTFFDTELILSAKFVCADPQAANSGVSVIITLSDPSDSEKKVVREMAVMSYPMSGMQRIVRIAQNYSGCVSYAPGPVSYKVLDLRQFGVLDEESIGDWTTSEIGNTYNAGEGTLHKTNVIGKIKLGSTTFDNGWGTTNYARVYFGGETQNFYMEYRPVKQYLEFGYNTGSGNQSLGETYRITKTDAEAAGLTFFDTELVLSVKFLCDYPETDNTNISIIFTLSDPNSSEKKVVREMELTSYPMSGMQRVVRFAQNYSGCITYAPGPITYKTLNLKDFGVLDEKSIGDWTTTESGNTYNAGEGTLHEVDVIGTYKFDEYEFNNGYGTTNYARVYFGGETQNFYMEYRPVKEYLEFGYNTGSGNQSLGETYRITKADVEAAGLTFFNTNLILSTKFVCINPEAENTDVCVVITLSDPNNSEKNVVRKLLLSNYPMGGMKRIVRIAQNYSGRLTYGPVIDSATLVVGGGDTNTAAFNVVVEQGDTLPTGYTTDGKYILGWTADDSAVTTYDKTKTNYVAQFVDTKMLTVKQQNNGATPKNVRFIASLNTLTGYDEAGFVFANRAVDGDLTITNGKQVVLNTAYSALNAAGTSVTADNKYDAYSNYFIAYALKEIPAEVTIYARAYVKIDDTIIYGSMSTFDIDSLN